MFRRSWLMLVIVVSLAVVAGLSLLTRGDRTAESLFDAGVSAIDGADLLRAEDIIEQLDSRTDGQEFVRVLRGGLLIAARQNESGLRLLDPTRAIGHVRQPSLRWASQGLVNLRMLAQAELLLRTAVTEFPDDADAHRLLAVLYYDLGAMYPALDVLGRLQTLAPNDFRPFHLAGVIHLDFEQYPEAVTDFTHALEQQPPEPQRSEIELSLARTHLRLRDYNNAIAVLETTSARAERRGLEAQAWLGLAQIDRAAELLDRADETTSPDQENPEILRARARLQLHTGASDDCLKTLEQLTRLEPHNIEAHHQIAQVLGQLGRVDEQQAAIARVDHVRDLRRRLADLSLQANAAPRDCDVKASIADICEQLGRTDLARVWRDAAAACHDQSADTSRQPSTR